MTFQPVLPLSGLPGWVFLNSTLDKQMDAFNAAPLLIRDTDYFEAKIDQITTAEELVSDRRLLRVALGAFNLQDDIDNRFLIRKILEGGVENDDALANRLSDERYKLLASAFGFGDGGTPNTQDTGFGAEMTTRFRQRAFEVAVGEQDQSLRLAMNAQRELAEIAANDDNEDTKWFRIMGTPPLRKLFETALGLPDSFAQLDLDRQLDIFKEGATNRLNIQSLSDLTQDNLREDVIRKFLLRDQIASINVQSSQSIALTLLQAAPRAF